MNEAIRNSSLSTACSKECEVDVIWQRNYETFLGLTVPFFSLLQARRMMNKQSEWNYWFIAVAANISYAENLQGLFLASEIERNRSCFRVCTAEFRKLLVTTLIFETWRLSSCPFSLYYLLGMASCPNRTSYWRFGEVYRIQSLGAVSCSENFCFTILIRF